MPHHVYHVIGARCVARRLVLGRGTARRYLLLAGSPTSWCGRKEGVRRRNEHVFAANAVRLSSLVWWKSAASRPLRAAKKRWGGGRGGRKWDLNRWVMDVRAQEIQAYYLGTLLPASKRE